MQPAGPLETPIRRARRVEACLFLASWLAFGYFHQGGGWVQNARFATVRAIVERGTSSPDGFLFYTSIDDPESRHRFVRTEIVEAGFRLRGVDHRLTWPGSDVSIDPDRTEERSAPLTTVASSPQLAYADPHFHPRQAPGLTLLAVVPYFVVFHVEQAIGLDPDDWWTLTVNGWLTSVLSVGLVSALGSVLFLRTVSKLWPGRWREAVWAAVAFSFGTLWFPNATMLHAENVVAVCLLGAAYALLRARELEGGRRTRALLVAGAAGGVAMITAYVLVVPVVLLAALAGIGAGRRGLAWFACGMAVPAAVGALYHSASFGSPFLTAFQFPHMMSHEPPALGSILERPNWLRVAVLLGSPFRGLFVTTPLLLLALPGLGVLARNRERRMIVGFAAALFATLLLFAACWRDWHGGWSFGPRILIPVLPFLALGLPWGFLRAPHLARSLALLSAAVMLLVTAVDAQPPVGVSGIAAIDRPTWLREPLTEFVTEIFVVGRANGILERQVDERVAKLEPELVEQGLPPEEWAGRKEEARRHFIRAIERGDGTFALALWIGPVSANPTGLFEPWPLNLHSHREPQVRWNAFNLGELVWPMSRLSLLPVIVLCSTLVAGALRFSRQGVVTLGDPVRRESRTPVATAGRPGANGA
jgi:hypothetical protein